jgi:hypothetical protein
VDQTSGRELTINDPVVVRLSAPMTTPPSNRTAMMDVYHQYPRAHVLFLRNVARELSLTPKFTSPFFRCSISTPLMLAMMSKLVVLKSIMCDYPFTSYFVTCPNMEIVNELLYRISIEGGKR